MMFVGQLDKGLRFNANVGFTLLSVDVFPTASGDIEIALYDSAENVIDTYTGTVTSGGPVTLNLDFDIPMGTGYKIVNSSTDTFLRDLGRSNAGNTNYPYDLGPNGGLGEIIGGIDGPNNSSSYFDFYNWSIGENVVLCESPREEVVASITQDGDINITSIPYIDVNKNTSSYGNRYSGAPGSNCGASDGYLNGDEVIYTYTATSDDSIDIVLQDLGLNDFYASLFIYESCSDIGTECLAGEVNGATNDDLEINGFTVQNGNTYYIVVSSWHTPNIDYTLVISDFTCSSFAPPIGDVVQTFTANDTLADLDVQVTLSGGFLTWYSDATASTTIPETTVLTDDTTYYVSQTFGSCESPVLAIRVLEVDCANMEISSIINDTVVCKGTGELVATPSGIGNEIYWYDAEIDGNRIGTGATLETTEVSNTTSYWASEVFVFEPELYMNIGKTVPSGLGPTMGSYQNIGLGFDVYEAFTLKSVEIFPDTSGELEIALYDNTGNLINSATQMVVKSNDPVTIPLYFYIEPGMDYRLLEISKLLKDDVTQNNYPYDIGPNGDLGSITRGVRYLVSNNEFLQNYGYYSCFYNWAVETGTVMCESDRTEAVLTIDPAGDKIISSLNYTDTDDTSNYGSNFYGNTSCGETADYLDGDDVVYTYSPTVDNIITVELTGVTNNDTGVFIYKGDCVDIGTNCLAGTIEDNGVYLIEEFYITGGEDYYIVVASESGSTEYTINVTEFDCNNDLDTPIGDAVQFYVGTQDLSFLKVEEVNYSTGLSWYSDANGTISIPESTTLVDGATYYVSQTVLGCESDLLAITTDEVVCSDLEIVSTIEDVICESGIMTLFAQGSGAGNTIYWYEVETGGSPIGIGEEFETPNLTTTTSYWVEEAFIDNNDVELCNSNRTEVIAKVNTIPTPLPIADTTQGFCTEINTIGDLDATGDNLKWYDENEDLLSESSPIHSGESYCVTQTIEACESDFLEIMVIKLENSDAPQGDDNQTFYEGETIADLDVTGENILWYSDMDKLEPLPESTELVDQVVYYATQTVEGECESQPLAIKAHETLNVADVMFDSFTFHPNPVSENLFISNAQAIDKIEIYDLTGRKVYERKHNNSTIELNVAELSKGAYLMKVTIDTMSKTFRIIKK